MRFNQIGLPTLMPVGGLYCFTNISDTKLDSNQFAMKLLKSKKVAVVPGSAFNHLGESCYIRSCFASSLENIKLAIDRIEAFVSQCRTS